MHRKTMWVRPDILTWSDHVAWLQLDDTEQAGEKKWDGEV